MSPSSQALCQDLKFITSFRPHGTVVGHIIIIPIIKMGELKLEVAYQLAQGRTSRKMSDQGTSESRTSESRNLRTCTMNLSFVLSSGKILFWEAIDKTGIPQTSGSVSSKQPVPA